jgi:hypothetical protein
VGVFCGHGPPTSVATVARRSFAVISVNETFGLIKKCITLRCEIFGCAVLKIQRIVHTRACLKEVGIALGGARGGWRRRGLCGVMEKKSEKYEGLGW